MGLGSLRVLVDTGKCSCFVLWIGEQRNEIQSAAIEEDLDEGGA